MEAVLINCNDCAHCVDLHTPSPADAPTLTNARNHIQSVITQWLTPTQQELDEAFGKTELPSKKETNEGLFLQKITEAQE